MNSSQRFFLTVAVMSATIMQVLDTTIVNVALPQMQGELSATPDQISWVLTSYLVASAIMMPLTGFFSDMLGRKKYLLICISGFVLASMLCGIAQNLTEIVLFRMLQGIFGAALVPLSQAIMVNTYPLKDRAKAMAIWGMGVMIGPIAGPTAGGWLTEVLDWRWTFFINLPVGIISFLLAARFVPDTEKRLRRMDWSGFILLALAIGGLQYFLDRGNGDDWFSSTGITMAVIIGIVGLLLFLWHSLLHPDGSLFSLAIFRDRNFVTASLVITALGLGMYGAMIIQPTMLEGLMAYPTSTAGLVMAPRGIASMISMMLVGRMMKTIDARHIIVAGMVLSAWGNYLCTHFNLQISPQQIIFPSLLQGFGLGFMMVPLTTIALSTIKPHLVPDASGVYSLLRTIGSSIGIAVISTIYSRATQMNWQTLGGGIQPFNPALQHYLARLPANSAGGESAVSIARELARQASMAAVVDAYWWITASFILMLPLVLLLKPLPNGAEAAEISE
ncbi:MAG: DHA2 family efflux MFS transporter permease subunit [bacterium]|nr:DHA2 family efflux MFS transporter permease subunit [bacterium]